MLIESDTLNPKLPHDKYHMLDAVRIENAALELPIRAAVVNALALRSRVQP